MGIEVMVTNDICKTDKEPNKITLTGKEEYISAMAMATRPQSIEPCYPVNSTIVEKLNSQCLEQCLHTKLIKRWTGRLLIGRRQTKKVERGPFP